MPVLEHDRPEPARTPGLDVLVDPRIGDFGQRAQQRRTDHLLRKFSRVQNRLGALLAAERHAHLLLGIDGAYDAHASVRQFDRNGQTPGVQQGRVEARESQAHAHLARHDFEQVVDRRPRFPRECDTGILRGRPHTVMATDGQHGVEPCRVLFRQFHFFVPYLLTALESPGHASASGLAV